MQTVIHNQQMLDTIIADIQAQFNLYKHININYEKSHKEKTARQIGFIFGGIISGLTDHFLGCGFNVDSTDVKYKLYKDVGSILPDVVVDSFLFKGEPRIKHISEMDRELLSKFIDATFTVLDTFPLYENVRLHPSIYYNWAYHLDPEEVKLAQQQNLPERDAEYLEHIRTMPCICCGVQHRSEAHHLKDNRLGGISQKSPDWTALPLCHQCHLGIAHGSGWKNAMGWIPIDLDIFTRMCYIRWKNKR